MPRVRGAVCLQCHTKVWTRDGYPVRCRCGETEVYGAGDAMRVRGLALELVTIVIPYQQLSLPL